MDLADDNLDPPATGTSSAAVPIGPAPAARANGQHHDTLTDPAFSRLVLQVRQLARVKQLVAENLGLVGYIKKKVLGRVGKRFRKVDQGSCRPVGWNLPYGLDPDDLFQEGVMALDRAAKGFDPARGWQFSTYAGTSIENALWTLIHGWNPGTKYGLEVNLPHERDGPTCKHWWSERLRGRLCGWCGLTTGYLTPSPSFLCGICCAGGRIARDVAVFYLGASLHEVDIALGDTPGGERIRQQEERSAVPEAVVRRELEKELREALARLPPREKLLVTMRFGLDGSGQEHTTEEVAAAHGLPPDLAQQLLEGALGQLQTTAGPYLAEWAKKVS